MMDSQADFGNKLAQLDQLLRLYRTCKKDFGMELIKTIEPQANSMVSELKTLNPQMYNNAKQKIQNLISMSFQEKSLKPEKKISSKLSSVSLLSQQSSIKSFKDLNQISSNELILQSRKSSPFSQLMQVQSIKKVERSVEQSSKQPASSFQMKSPQRNSDDLQQSSMQMSGQSNTSTAISIMKNFVRTNIAEIERKMVINYDLMTDAKLAKGQIYLVGVHLIAKKLVICTKMKLSISQIQNRQNNYQKELSEFRNTQRHPVGIFLNGEIKDLKPHFIYLLGILDSPWPFIFLMKDIVNYDGLLIKYNANTVQTIIQADFKMLNTPFNIQLVQNPDNFRMIQIAENMQLLKQKVVVSKTLNNISKQNKTQKASHAIQVLNESMKEQMGSFKFPYKVHTKFLTSMKGNYDIYVINNQNVIAGRKKQNDLASFQSQVQKSKLPFILSMGVTKADKVIDKGFLIAVLLTNESDPFGLINLVTTKDKRTLIFRIKPGVTEQKIQNSQNLTASIMENEQNQITMKIDVITSKNYKNYESQSKVTLTQLKGK